MAFLGMGGSWQRNEQTCSQWGFNSIQWSGGRRLLHVPSHTGYAVGVLGYGLDSMILKTPSKLVMLYDGVLQRAPSEGCAHSGDATDTRRQSPSAQLSLRKFLWFDCFCAVGALIFRGRVPSPPSPPTDPELMAEVWTLYRGSARPHLLHIAEKISLFIHSLFILCARASVQDETVLSGQNTCTV